MTATSNTLTPPAPGRARRYLYAALGVACVALAGLGVLLPGMPTTVFLIMAAWLFTRSCPWLAERLIFNRFFAPFTRHLRPGSVMPRRAKAIALAMMWTAIALTTALMLTRHTPWPIPALVIAAGVVGTWAIGRQGGKAGHSALGTRHSGRNS